MSSVVELTPDNFDNPLKLKKSDLSNKGITIIKYYSPNCIHCIQSQPEYEGLATVLKNDKSFKVAQIDCSKYSSFISKINGLLTGPKIEGYPTYLIFVNSLFLTVYNGSRDANAMQKVLSIVKTGTGV